MRFLVDAQLPPKIVQWLRSMGHEADHVGPLLGARAPDASIVAQAKMNGAVVLSKDGDFVALLDATDDAPLLLWVRTGNTTNRALVARLEALWPRIEAELIAGKQIVEVD